MDLDPIEVWGLQADEEAGVLVLQHMPRWWPLDASTIIKIPYTSEDDRERKLLFLHKSSTTETTDGVIRLSVAEAQRILTTGREAAAKLVEIREKFEAHQKTLADLTEALSQISGTDPKHDGP